MARNGSGTYTVVNTFVSGNPITAAGHNQNWSDLASEMTNSVAVDGQSTMTGQLKASTGTAAAPSYTFSGDLNCGFYRIGADNIGAACAGAKVLDVSATGLGVTGTLVTSGTITATGSQINAGTHLAAVGGLYTGTGNATTPAHSFADDQDCGAYRIGANNIGYAVNGAKVLDIGTGGLTVVGTLSCDTLTVGTSFSNAAAQADQETATATGKLVTPAVQQFHPSAAKFWIKGRERSHHLTTSHPSLTPVRGF
jgi:hypothetical protein